MKIRHGFVSNSSSSSFLVAFPRNPKSVDDLHEMVFGEEDWFAHPYSDVEYYPDGWPSRTISEILWKEIKGQIPNNKNRALNIMYNVLVYNYDDFEFGNKDEYGQREFDTEAYIEANKQEVTNFFSQYEGCFIYYFKFHDDSGEPEGYGMALEHGSVFSKLPHLVSPEH